MSVAARPRPSRDGPRRPRPGRPPSPATVRDIYRRLEERFGPLDHPRRLDPLDELILTVLSQNTSDINSERAYVAMRRRYPSWEALAEAEVEDLVSAIRPGGLANVKAPRILAILREIQEREGGSLDLSWMRQSSSELVREYLLSLPGVGPKTAACVLAFSLGRPALPVDTHVLRVAGRLGFFASPGRAPHVDAFRAHDVMEVLVPEALRVGIHVGMVRLGRLICRAGRPSCEICPLNEICPTAPAVRRRASSRSATGRSGQRKGR